MTSHNSHNNFKYIQLHTHSDSYTSMLLIPFDNTLTTPQSINYFEKLRNNCAHQVRWKFDQHNL